MAEFLSRGIIAEMRALPAGDFTWIAREKLCPTQVSRGKELVLDVVIERKRVDDLASSITDGRFHEQKHRLKKCGVRRPTYLVESLTRGGSYSVPYRSLSVAVTNSQVVDGFDIKMTSNNNETLLYLETMTRYLTKVFSGRELFSCSYSETQEEEKLPSNYMLTFLEFEQSSKKITNFNVREMLLKQLLQLSGVSVVKAKAITELYPTVDSLLTAYRSCDNDKQREKLLAGIKSNGMAKSLGPVVSKKLYNFYTFKRNETPLVVTTISDDESD